MTTPEDREIWERDEEALRDGTAEGRARGSGATETGEQAENVLPDPARVARYAEFQTKPNPDQPGRCPSIDPHDTLQCTRSIHDDDQCVCGGIGWRKGSPRYVSDRERAEALAEDVAEYDGILSRQGDLLTRTVNVLRGDPPPLTSWSHHDVPELAAALVAERDELRAEVERLRGPFRCCKHCPEDQIHDVEPNAHDLPCTICEDTLRVRAEAAEAKVARVEALADEWANRWDVPEVGRFDPNAKAYRMVATDLRAVLADVPAEQRAEGDA